ncbi:GNAT family N-acetyltransferase [Streptomyces decoyicus]
MAAIVREQIGPVVVDGIEPASPQADPIVSVLMNRRAHLLDRRNDAESRCRLLARLESMNDPRRERYFSLLAVLKGVASGKPSAEAGYWTAAQARGRGVAPRAVETLTTWSLDAFRAEGLECLELLHQVDNLASCRVAEECGYQFDRTLPAAPPSYPLDGHLHIRRAVA